jgi:hypothetical protein
MLPDWLGAVAKLTLNYWGHEALQVLTFGGGWNGIATHLVVLGALGATMTVAGMMLLGRRHVRGAI